MKNEIQSGNTEGVSWAKGFPDALQELSMKLKYMCITEFQEVSDENNKSPGPSCFRKPHM